MNSRSTTQTKTSSSFSPIQTGLLQRECNSCGQHTIAGGECTGCAKKRVSLQRKLTIGSSNDPLELEALNPNEVVAPASQVLNEALLTYKSNNQIFQPDGNNSIRIQPKIEILFYTCRDKGCL